MELLLIFVSFPYVSLCEVGGKGEACELSEVGGSETNREIDFGFGSCVRARALAVRWEFGQILMRPLSLFPFPPAVPFPFPFSPSGFAGKPIMLCVINTKQNTQSAEFLVEKEHSPLEIPQAMAMPK